MAGSLWFARFDLQDAPGADQLPPAAEARLYRAEEGAECCLYLVDPVGGTPAGDWAGARGWSRLEALQDLPGADAARPAPWHYIVATDVQPEAEHDFNDWYAQEHLPGLAAVPGTARAARYRQVEGQGPQYHAAYDLADRAAFNSPAWLAVRATDWSSRVRPAFRNTLRRMYWRVEPD